MSKNPKRIWYAVDVLVESAASEAAEFALNELDSLGSEIDNLRKQPDEPVCVTGFFDYAPGDNIVRASVDDALRIYHQPRASLISIRTRKVEETDWLAEWKRHWKPQKVARFTIAPPWSDVEPSDQIVIRIEPNMAFGTGTHETTQLCLAAISEKYDPGQSFMDVGTGTGILAIAAAKLGGTNILAYDVDHDSVAIAMENAIANEVSEKITFAEGSITNETPPFDLVCANLTIDVIEPLLPLLVEKTSRLLILSGILADQEAAALNALNDLFVKDQTITRAGEWIAITVRV